MIWFFNWWRPAMPISSIADGQANHDALQSQLATSQRNATSITLARELSQLQGSMASDLAKLKEKREALKADREKTRKDDATPTRVGASTSPARARWDGASPAEAGKSVAERLAEISGKPAPAAPARGSKTPMAEVGPLLLLPLPHH